MNPMRSALRLAALALAFTAVAAAVDWKALKHQGYVNDFAGVLDALKVQKADLVTHDIGNMVGYSFAAQFPSRVLHPRRL